MDLRFLQARDSILAYLQKSDFTDKEIKKVLQMCNDEVDAWENRSKLIEVNKEEE